MEKQTRVASATPAAAFIQADAATFKALVQKLTGATGGSASAHKLRPKAATPFKLQERRKHAQSLTDLEIIKLRAKSAGNSPAGRTDRSSNELFSPVKAPLTPLGRESVVRTESEEEKAIVDKGFYLHASPAKAETPLLLTLFPLTP